MAPARTCHLRVAGHNRVPLWLGVGREWRGWHLPLTICSSFLITHLSGPSWQRVDRVVGAAGPLRCRALPHPRPAAPLQGSPLLSAGCRCSCICGAYRTVLATCVASFSSCASSRYRAPHLHLLTLPRLCPTFPHYLTLAEWSPSCSVVFLWTLLFPF